MKNILIYLTVIIAVLANFLQSQTKTGLDVLVESEFQQLQGLRLGIIINQTAVSRNGIHLIDLLKSREDLQLAAIFGPEHGIYGRAEAGKKIKSAQLDSLGIPVYSLYGITRSPSDSMFQNIDALVFDIQDVGTRFYTYISTMSKTMQAAAAFGLKYFILDRPNPVGGEIVEGPVLEPELRSFVGIHPIALRHGMTVGELGKMFLGEGWLKQIQPLDLTVIKMQNWQRTMLYENTGLSWVPPSPNMPVTDTAILYCGMGLLEATNVSEGRGTRSPFQKFGAPWLENHKLISLILAAGIKNVRLQPVTFTPVDIPGMATNNKYSGELCRGVELSLLDATNFKSVHFGITLLTILQKHYQEKFKLKENWLRKLAGKKNLAKAIRQGKSATNIIAGWEPDLKKFLKKRSKYLLY